MKLFFVHRKQKMIAINTQEQVEVFINIGGGISMKQPDAGHDTGYSFITISIKDVEKLVRALRKVAKGEEE